MKNPQEFWKYVHDNNYRKYLGLYSPKRVLAYHKIEPKSLIGKRVMDFGVGDGSMANYLHDLKAEAVAVDIVKEALDKVECEQHLTNNLNDCLPVDVAICHLLFQHCENAEIRRILKGIQLNPNGYISFQVAELTKEGNYYWNDRKKRTVIFHDYTKICNLIEDAGRTLIESHRCLVKDPVWWLFFKIA